MELKGKKLAYLLAWLLWYIVMVQIITPALINYLFSGSSILVEVFAAILSLCLPTLVILLFSKSKQNKEQLLFNIHNEKIKSISLRKIIYWCLIVILLEIFVIYFINIFEIWYIIKTENYSIISTLPGFHWVTFIVLIITSVLFPSVFEELVFRGMYYDTLYNCGNIILFVVPTVVFASLHNSVVAFVNAFLLGATLMLCYKKNQSIKLVMLLHAINNVISIILSNITTLPLSPLRVLDNYANEQQMVGAILYYIGMIIACIWLIIFCLGKLKLNETEEREELSKVTLTKANWLIIILIVAISITAFILKLVL